jgi:hypothetical protein
MIEATLLPHRPPKRQGHHRWQASHRRSAGVSFKRVLLEPMFAATHTLARMAFNPELFNSRPGFFYASGLPPTSLPGRPIETNSPPRFPLAGLVYDRAVLGNRQISICRAP